ncbi:hypothetical protein O59_004301 [Cellvibrio sp. BR]|uniref:hypothetical protein n=1 Tax=unclassified Cellvibrio TaxID=2624793 RepID=UPI0002600D9B|nr:MULTISPECIES: hypothetical protein [unclassified Cellvibrio]EIK42983.1 hypothetical protein O59_004301 [Cellvibrio sp. BR]UUA75094.1 hypothetical protein NNX04_21835 [Cellvibrio sp. QJXJ]
MTQLGEKTASGKESIPAELTVNVVDSCSDKGIENAEIRVCRKLQMSDKNGKALFSEVNPGGTAVYVKVHTKDADYSTFISHYPRFLRSQKAVSLNDDVISLKAGQKETLTIKLDVHKVIKEVVFHRRHIDFGGEDKYGHWWSVFDMNMSFGWWPKYPVGSYENRRSSPPKPPPTLGSNAGWKEKIQHKFDTLTYEAAKKLFEIKESGPSQTFRGVEGELNGVTYFQGIAKNGIYKDPHDLGGDTGNEQYSPVILECIQLDKIKNRALDFSLSYSGDWSWRLEAGNHCHTFQKKLMAHLVFKKYKVLK